MDDEERLIERLAAGDDHAFAEAVALHQGRVRAYLARWLRGRDVVDDLAQEVFLAAYRGIAGYDRRVPLALWLLGIARHRALAHLRDLGRRRAREVAGVDEALLGWRIAALELDEQRSGMRADELAALEACLAQLPERSARLVSAHYLQGESLTAIAGRSGRGDGAVRMALARIRQALRECISRRLAEHA
jgi:RNA polymerase sigma-70 factor (ECF subfamily)